jgi:hypothetical protein
MTGGSSEQSHGQGDDLVLADPGTGCQHGIRYQFRDDQLCRFGQLRQPARQQELSSGTPGGGRRGVNRPKPQIPPIAGWLAGRRRQGSG